MACINASVLFDYKFYKIMKKQIKTKERVKLHGEVFTADREVKAMCDLVSDECMRYDSMFLEPACGNGNFLVEILERKLESIKDDKDYLHKSIIAVGSIYGIDIMLDNILECRGRLFNLWLDKYKEYNHTTSVPFTAMNIHEILSHNIIHGNFLTCMFVDDNGNDTDLPILISKWVITNDELLQTEIMLKDLITNN